MVHIGTADVIEPSWAVTKSEPRTAPGHQVILVVRDHDRDNDYLHAVCEFLDIGVELTTTGDDLPAKLFSLSPMAVIADLDSEIQDGFHVMKMTAGYDRSLPILLLTSNDPAMLGAIDAVQEVWGLTRVTTAAASAGIGALMDFICHAARTAGRSRLMRV
jgi:CheY-like chemotaxis protein